jgi:hypothetical protein
MCTARFTFNLLILVTLCMGPQIITLNFKLQRLITVAAWSKA